MSVRARNARWTSTPVDGMDRPEEAPDMADACSNSVPIMLKNRIHLTARAETQAFILFVPIVRLLTEQRFEDLNAFGLADACSAATLANDLKHEYHHPGVVDHYEMRRRKET